MKKKLIIDVSIRQVDATQLYQSLIFGPDIVDVHMRRGWDRAKRRERAAWEHPSTLDTVGPFPLRWASPPCLTIAVAVVAALVVYPLSDEHCGESGNLTQLLVRRRRRQQEWTLDTGGTTPADALVHPREAEG